MKYQLDTDVIIYHLRGQRKFKVKWLQNRPIISVITLGELLYGAQKSNQPQKTIKMVNSYTLVTNNKKHFSKIPGLKIY